MEMNEIEKQADDLVYKKENVSLELSFLYFSFCVVYTVILIVLSSLEEINEFQIKIWGFIDIILCCLPYIRKKIKIYTLKNDEEYQLAKQILKKYEEKAKKENLKIELKETFEEEQRKSDKIKEFKKFLNEDNEK